ncbi:MAG: hypothetical protein ABEH80_01700, partial [Halobaculum sp.]
SHAVSDTCGMKIPVTQESVNGRQVVDVRIEEVATIAFDLGESPQYAEVGDIQGRLLVGYDLNRGAVVDTLRRVQNPGLDDQIDALLRGWSAEAVDTAELTFQFGALLLRGTEPLDIPELIPLTTTVETETFEQTSPRRLKRELREASSYRVDFDDLADDIERYLRAEGIPADAYEMGMPVHLQARAEPVAEERGSTGDETASSDRHGRETTPTTEQRRAGNSSAEREVVTSSADNEQTTPTTSHEQTTGLPAEHQQGADATPARRQASGGHAQDLYGTEFSITVENRAPREVGPSTVRVAMRPRIGREVVTRPGTEGSYNPEDGVFEFELSGLSSDLDTPAARERIEFVVPQSARAALDRLEGTAVLNTSRPFTNYLPEAVFDAGGRKVYDAAVDETDDSGDSDSSSEQSSDESGETAPYASVNWTCSIQAEFYAPTDEIVAGSGAEIEKRIVIDGLPPTKAESKVERTLAQRGIDTTGGITEQGTETREGTQVTTFDGEFADGSTVVDGARITISIGVTGERRTGEMARKESTDDNLPAKQRNTTFEYGRTGLTIRGRGADPETVEQYLADLRNELQLSLESLAEEV